MIYYNCSRVFSHLEIFLHHPSSATKTNPPHLEVERKKYVTVLSAKGIPAKCYKSFCRAQSTDARIRKNQTEAHELKLEQQKEEEMHRSEAFAKRTEEIGYANALIEASTNVDTAIAEAKMALKGAIVYKK